MSEGQALEYFSERQVIYYPYTYTMKCPECSGQGGWFGWFMWHSVRDVRGVVTSGLKIIIQLLLMK